MAIQETETGLVKHTPREQIILKIYKRKEKREEEWSEQRKRTQMKRTSEKELMKKFVRESPEEFYKMIFLREFDHKRIYEDTCLTIEELYECTDAELEAFEELIFRSVRSGFRKDIYSMLFIPIFGWMFGIATVFAHFSYKDCYQFDEYHYLKYRKIAQKKGISLASVIREHIEMKRKEETHDIQDAFTL